MSEIVSTLDLEKLKTADLRWLAGGLQVGGSVRFERDGDHPPYPVIKIGDNNQSRIDQIITKFGGYKKHPKNKKTYYWVVSREDATVLGGLIEPFSPLHQNIIAGFKDWAATNNPEKRKIIAQKIPLPNHRNLASDIYEQLVTQPDFCAGVYDFRGRKGQYKHSDGKGGGWFIPEVHVHSRNHVVLQELKSQYNGRLRTRGFSSKKAEVSEPDLNEYNSFVWILGTRAATVFLSTIREHLIFRAEEADEVINWRLEENKF